MAGTFVGGCDQVPPPKVGVAGRITKNAKSYDGRPDVVGTGIGSSQTYEGTCPLGWGRLFVCYL